MSHVSDGQPNKLMQKLLRELGLVQQVASALMLPFQKGLALEELGQPQHKEKMAPLVTLMNLFYRLLKQMAKENLRNAKEVYKHLGSFRKHLGRGVLVTPTVKEIFAGKRELINLINQDLVNHFMSLLEVDKAPQYIDFLMSVCTCPEPLPNVQVRASKPESIF